jgi:hypothetical protein
MQVFKIFWISGKCSKAIVEASWNNFALALARVGVLSAVSTIPRDLRWARNTPFTGRGFTVYPQF